MILYWINYQIYSPFFQVKQINYCNLIILQLLLFYSPQVLSLLKSKNKLQYCERTQSKCMEMNHSILCLGVKLPYTSTSTDLVLDADTLEEAQVSKHVFTCFMNYILHFYHVLIIINRRGCTIGKDSKKFQNVGQLSNHFYVHCTCLIVKITVYIYHHR